MVDAQRKRIEREDDEQSACGNFKWASGPKFYGPGRVGQCGGIVCEFYHKAHPRHKISPHFGENCRGEAFRAKQPRGE